MSMSQKTMDQAVMIVSELSRDEDGPDVHEDIDDEV